MKLKTSEKDLETHADLSGLTPAAENTLNFNVIILAAGLSSRMKEGSSKTLKLVEGESILNRLVRQFENDASGIVIVTGFMNQEVENHIYKKEKVVFVNNDRFKEDKNILSCFLGLQQSSNASLIIEGDVILSDSDVKKMISLIYEKPEVSFVASQVYSKENMKRIGCVSKRLYLLPQINIQNTDNRMAGVFYLSQKDALNLKSAQREIVENDDLSKYYFTPLIREKDVYKLENFVVSSSSHTVNTKEEYEWALKNLN